ncbi:hypothetical protein M1D58_27425 (plasmid) [Pseudomonas sp. R4-76]|uniref:hypothetical protein n=1 Tax=unclassified Pseudomonas TaxID=196821 RepID=UPI003DA9FB97
MYEDKKPSVLARIRRLWCQPMGRVICVFLAACVLVGIVALCKGIASDAFRFAQLFGIIAMIFVGGWVIFRAASGSER